MHKQLSKAFRWLIILCILGISQGLDAQNFGYRILGGANFCQIDGDQLSGYNKLGYRFGLGSFIPVKSGDELGIEITYSQKGSRTASDPDNPGKVIVRYNYNYLEVPFYYQRKIKKFGLRFGLVPSYLIGAQADLGGGFSSQSNVRSFELSGLAGPVYNINDRWSFYLHYQYSITSIIDQKKAPFSNFRRTGVYNHLISTGLYYNFSN